MSTIAGQCCLWSFVKTNAKYEALTIPALYKIFLTILSCIFVLTLK